MVAKWCIINWAVVRKRLFDGTELETEKNAKKKLVELSKGDKT